MADDDDLPDLSKVTGVYERALWVVVALNIGYGAVEIAGGYFAGSQALKADTLGFMGDGLITFLAFNRGELGPCRARPGSAAARHVSGAARHRRRRHRGYSIPCICDAAPEAHMMGLFGIIALGVNVIAALVLLPHREGDANMRAVWLFSRMTRSAILPSSWRRGWSSGHKRRGPIW